VQAPRTPVPSKQIPPGGQANLFKPNTPAPAGSQLPGRPGIPGRRETTPVTVDYKKSLAGANDYWAYAHQVLPAGKAGNADAQFYLSRALERCDEDNRLYFQRRGQRLTLDEGLQYAVKRHLSIEVAQSVYEKCHQFQENDSAEFGSAADWLAKATAAGQPLAETTTASKLLVQEMQQNFPRAGDVPNPNTSPKIENASDPRSLFRSAVVSKDPEVLFVIGDSQGLLDPASSDSNTRRFAWWLVACQRGFGCSENAEWVKKSCGDDAGCRSASSPSDRVRSLAGDQWPEVQQRAQEISAALDADQWDKLNLRSGVTANN